MKDLKLEIAYVPVGQLTPYKNNAKLHPQEQIDQIKASINEFGMVDPIAVWGENNIIVEGHGRLLACQQLGIETVPIIRLDNLTEDQRKAYTVAHNQLTMNSGFDNNMLAVELESIDLDMSAFGFDEFALDQNFGTDFELPEGDKSELEQITFTLHTRQAQAIRAALERVGECSETFGNTNKNGNALYEVVRQWEELRK